MAFVLTLAFGGLQTVALTDCCCLHGERPLSEKAACQGCEGPSAPATPPDDCCGAPRPSTPGCVHVQPSHEVVVDLHDAPLLPETVLALPLVEAPSAFVDDARRASGDAVHRPERGRPLYLLDSTLLI